MPAPRRLLEAFLAGRRPTTLRAYRGDLDDFRRFSHCHSIAEAVDRLVAGGPGAANESALAWRTDLSRRGLSPATINRRLAALRSLVKLARTFGMVGWSVEIRGLPAHAYRDTRGPGTEGFLRVLAALRGRSLAARRDRAILHLLFDLALRRAEVAALDVCDLDLDRSSIAVMGKGRLEKQRLSLPAETAAVLGEWLARRPGPRRGPLFVRLDRATSGARRLSGQAIYEIVRMRSLAAGLRRVHPHGLRHAAITEAVRSAQAAGLGVEDVLAYSRHASLSTLQVYVDRQRDIQGQVAALVAGAGSEPPNREGTREPRSRRAGTAEIPPRRESGA